MSHVDSCSLESSCLPAAARKGCSVATRTSCACVDALESQRGEYGARRVDERWGTGVSTYVALEHCLAEAGHRRRWQRESVGDEGSVARQVRRAEARGEAEAGRAGITTTRDGRRGFERLGGGSCPVCRRECGPQSPPQGTCPCQRHARGEVDRRIGRPPFICATRPLCSHPPPLASLPSRSPHPLVQGEHCLSSTAPSRSQATPCHRRSEERRGCLLRLPTPAVLLSQRVASFESCITARQAAPMQVPAVVEQVRALTLPSARSDLISPTPLRSPGQLSQP